MIIRNITNKCIKTDNNTNINGLRHKTSLIYCKGKKIEYIFTISITCQIHTTTELIMPEQANTNKVLKGVSTQTLITILTGVIEIVAFSIMSRLLSQQDFGYYAAVTAVSTIFASFADAGIGSAIVQRKVLDQKYIDNAFTLCLLFGLFGSLLLVACSRPAARYVADETMQVPLMLVAITLLTNTIASVNFSIMHRKLQFLRIGIIRISALIITTVVSIILAIKGFGYYAIIAKVILYSIITLIVSHFAAHTKYHISFDLKAF